MNDNAKLEKEEISIIKRITRTKKYADFARLFSLINAYYCQLGDLKLNDEVDIHKAEKVKDWCDELKGMLSDIQETLSFTIIDQKWTKEDKLNWFKNFISANSVEEKIKLIENVGKK